MTVARHKPVRNSTRHKKPHKTGSEKTVKAFLILSVFFSLFWLYAEAPRSVMQDFTNHLSYNGYKCTVQGNVVQAVHGSKLSFTLSRYGNGILIKAWFRKKNNEQESLQKLILIANEMNSKASLARFYADNEGDLVMSAWYPLPYTKDNFSSFLDTWETDFVVTVKEYYPVLTEYIE